MKRLLALVLIILMAFSLIACGKDESKETTSVIPTTIPATTAGTMAALEGSDKKLSELNSFCLTIRMDNIAGDARYVDDMVYLYQKNTDRTATIGVENLVKMYRGEESRENVAERRWYIGNVGFVSTDEGRMEKKIKDDGFDLSFVVGRTANFDIDPKSSTLIAEFAALSPQKSAAENGTTLYRLENMSRENCIKVYMAMTGMSQEANQMPPASAFHAQALVDAKGYLTQFRLDMLDVEAEGGKQSMVITFTIDQMNAVPTLEKPDYVKNFSITEDTTICHIQNGWDAYYRFTTKDSTMDGERGLWFVGFGRYARDSYTVDSYKICDQLDGIKVEGIRGAIYNSNSDVVVERLIVPVGMQIGGVDNSHGAENVTLFFESPESEVTKSFLLKGDAEDEYDPSTGLYRLRFHAAYYAGEWELVNGIPQVK